MNNAPRFYKTLAGSTESKVDAAMWDQATAHYDAGRGKESVLSVIDYANPGLRSKYSNADGTEMTIPHGSVNIHISLKDGLFTARAPFLELPQTNIVPLLRQVAQINFTPLNLAQVQLGDNKLEFFFQCPLSVAEPYKVYYAFRDICHYADIYDDEFTTKFGAIRLSTPNITPFNQEMADAAWAGMQEATTSCLEYINFFDSKRWYYFSWDILMITLTKIEYYINPQGMLRNDLEKAVSDMNGKDNVNDRTARAKAFVQKLQQMNKDSFVRDLYQAEVFIPYKWRTSLQHVQETLKTGYEQAQKEYTGKDYMGCTMTSLYHLYKLYYDNNVENAVAAVIDDGLQRASEKPWAEAAAALYGALDKIMRGDLSIAPAATPERQAPEKPKGKGLFGWLTGN